MDLKIKILDFTFLLDKHETGIKELIAHIRPSWRLEDLTVKALPTGLQNHIWKVTPPPPPPPLPSQNNHHGTSDQAGDGDASSSSSDAVVVRVFDASAAFYDREREFRILQQLAAHGAIMPIYCKFNNGYVYKYAKGEVLTAQQLVDPAIYRLIQARLHAVHATDTSGFLDQKPDLALADRFLAMFTPEVSRLVEDNASFQSHFTSMDAVVRSVRYAIDDVSFADLYANFPVVLIHGDPFLANIIYDKQTDSVALIDFDCYNVGVEVLDIAILLSRDAHNQFDGLDLITDTEFKQTWMREYLDTHPRFTPADVTPELVNKWLDGLNKAFYVTNVIVGSWALAQTVINPFKCDFWWLAKDSFGKAKLAEKYFNQETKFQILK